MFFGGLYVLQLKDLGPLAVEGASTMRYGYLEQGVDGDVYTVWSGVAKACTSECLADLSNIILEQSDTILKEIGIDAESINFLKNEAGSFLDTAGLGEFGGLLDEFGVSDAQDLLGKIGFSDASEALNLTKALAVNVTSSKDIFNVWHGYVGTLVQTPKYEDERPKRAQLVITENEPSAWLEAETISGTTDVLYFPASVLEADVQCFVDVWAEAREDGKACMLALREKASDGDASAVAITQCYYNAQCGGTATLHLLYNADTQEVGFDLRYTTCTAVPPAPPAPPAPPSLPNASFMNGDGLAPASCIRGVPETIRHTAGGFFVAITETSPSAADNMEGVLPRTAKYSTTVFDWYSETDTDEGFKLDVAHSSTDPPVDPTGAQPIKLGQVVLEAETTDITGVKHVYTKVMAADPTAGAAVPPGAKRLGFAFNTLYEKLPAVATPQRLALEFAVRDAIADDIGISKERVIFRGFEEAPILPGGRRLQESVSLGTNTMVKFDVMPGVSSEKTPQGVAVTASGLMGAPDGVAWDHLKKLWEAPCEGCGDYKLGLPVGGPDGTGAVYEYAPDPDDPDAPEIPVDRSTLPQPPEPPSPPSPPPATPSPLPAPPPSPPPAKPSNPPGVVDAPPAPPAEEEFELFGLTLTFLIIIAAGIVLLLILCCCLIFCCFCRGGGRERGRSDDKYRAGGSAGDPRFV